MSRAEGSYQYLCASPGQREDVLVQLFPFLPAVVIDQRMLIIIVNTGTRKKYGN